MVALFLIPISMANPESEKAIVQVYDFKGDKIIEKEVTYERAKEIEKDILNGDLGMLGIKFDLGFSNYLVSYGRGKVYIPFSKERSFFRLMLRPIFFNYEKGFTFVKFGANYIWKGKSIGDYGMMLRSQCGMMLGFYGVHIKISWKLRPDTHIFVGGNLLLVGNDKIL